MNQTEIYKTIPNYSNYEVSNIGNVRNKKTGHILSKGSQIPSYSCSNGKLPQHSHPAFLPRLLE